MTGKLKLYQKLLPVLFIPICLFIAFSYGWIAFATLTDRSGLNGSLFYYYRLSGPEFFLYNFIVSLSAMGYIFFQVYYLYTGNGAKLTKSFKWFGLFIAVLLIAEFMLQLRFVG